ncbi:hypothetical protein [Agromyces sp. NPDC058126]|uniref:hypothetical protein n=1 Tax=Agromyces sp. NPDC058126 TaxID=3346350 RepID=UPI0036DDCA46
MPRLAPAPTEVPNPHREHGAAARWARPLLALLLATTVLLSGLLVSPLAAHALDSSDPLPVVTGRIVDGGGAGVGDARVTLFRFQRQPTGQVAEHDFGWAVSTADGTYSIALKTPVSPGDYFRIVAVSPSSSPFMARTEGPLFRIDGSRAEADLEVQRSASVTGTLRDHLGRIVAGSVRLHRLVEGSAPELTAGRSQFSDRFSIPKVPPGEYLLEYQIEGEPALWWPAAASSADAERFELTDGSTRSFTLTTIQPAVVTGDVTGPDGEIDADAQVTAHRLVGDRLDQDRTAYADETGRFELRLMPGRYAFEYTGGPDAAREYSGGTSLLSAAELHDLAAGGALEQHPVLAPAASVAGRSSSRRVVVFDADGRIAGSIEPDYDEYRVGGLAAGAYTVRTLDGWDESPSYLDGWRSDSQMDASRFLGEWWPGVREESDAESVVVGEGEARDGIDFAEFEGAEIRGTVRLYDGGWMPVGDAVVTAVDSAGSDIASTESDVLGGFALEGVRPGEIRLRITPRSGAEWYWPAAETLESAGILTVKPNGYLTGVVTGRQATVSVPTISGTPAIGETLTASATSPIPGVEIVYRWVGGFAPAHVGPELVVTPEMANAEIKVTATATKAGYSTMTADSAWTPKVLKWGTPWFDDGGEPAVGVELLIRDAYGNTSGSTTTARQWFADGVPISGATGERYTPTVADEGKRLTVRTTGSAPRYADGSAVSEPSLRVIKPATPTISGIAGVGNVLKVDLGDWTDGAHVNWEWLLDGEWVVGYSQGDSEFTVPPEAVGKRISVIAWGSKDGYGEASMKSVATAKAVAARVPVITGTPYVGATLAANAGDWGAGAPVKFQWYANGSAIVNAQSSSFAPTSSQVGAQLSVRAYVDDPAWAPLSKTSASSTRVALAPVPTVSGTARVGGKLSAVPGTWTKGTVLSYQWFVGGVAVSGASSSSYTLPSSSAGKSVVVKVTGRLSGYPTVTQSSAATPKVLAWATPTVSGTTRTGGTMTANTGMWSSGTSFSYQWYADGVAVSGATGKTFVPSSAQVGKFLSVRVTGRQAGFGSMAVTSKASSTRVALAPVPTVSGTARVGGKLSAVPGTWTKGTVLSYQWFVGGVAVSGASSSSYTLPSSSAGKSVVVKVTGRLSGYPTVTQSSAATGSVVGMGTPTISGTAGVGETLVADAGSWSGASAFSYRWLADGEPIPAATEREFTIPPDLLGRRLAVRVASSGAGVAVVHVDSAPTAAVAAGVMQPGAPALVLDGAMLTADPGSWTPAVAFEYRWYLDGEPLGETGDVVDVTGRDGRYRVEIVGIAPGYASSVATSPELVVTTPVVEPPTGG